MADLPPLEGQAGDAGLAIVRKKLFFTSVDRYDEVSDIAEPERRGGESGLADVIEVRAEATRILPHGSAGGSPGLPECARGYRPCAQTEGPITRVLQQGLCLLAGTFSACGPVDAPAQGSVFENESRKVTSIERDAHSGAQPAARPWGPGGVCPRGRPHEGG